MKRFGFLLSMIPVVAYANLDICDRLLVDQNESNYTIEQIAETETSDFEIYVEEELSKALTFFENEEVDQEDLFVALEKNAAESESLSASLPKEDSQSYVQDEKSEIALQPSLESIPSKMYRPKVVPTKPQNKSSKKVISKAEETAPKTQPKSAQQAKAGVKKKKNTRTQLSDLREKKTAQSSMKNRQPKRVQKNNVVKRPTIEASEED